MTDTANDGASAPEVQQPAALKSTDTSATKVATPAPVEAKPETKPEPKQSTPTEVSDGGSTPPEGEEDDAPAAASPERKEQRLPRWMKERLERERQVTAARTREQVLRELQAEQPPVQQRQEVPQEREKTLEDFDFDPTAFQKYLARQAVEEYKREEQTRAEQQKQAVAAEQFKAKIDTFEARVGAGAWEDIESSPLNANPAYKPLVDLFLGDENDLDIAHHLARNLAEADRLLSLSPLQRVRELAKLADTFSAEPEKAAPAAPVIPPKKITNAPPPAKTVSGAGKPSVDINDPNISTADRIRAWRSQGG